MPANFWPDLLIALIGTFVGAVLTVYIAYQTYRMEFHRREREAIRHMAVDLSTKRSLRHASPAARVDSRRPDVEEDRQRCARSVLSSRDSIREAWRAARPGSDVQDDLEAMSRACNRYLEFSELDRDAYVDFLHKLHVELSASVNALQAKVKVPLPMPGSASS